ncbi:rho GTPase-activating protein 22 [Fundulus heteroclitus]|uniref:rho GTPase-activating protein 22 n=1 Tax=Fundulus heteroclitus TaxID=8078 RepID=UPI00165A673E|nr:rho GTPase-activating protein 22 [Fundulus heteroclitus]
MELPCLPTETPTSASSCSTDPLYDNCPPFGQRDRAREKETENGVVCPLVTRLPGPSSPLPGLVPALAEVQTTVAGGRGREPGSWPDRSYCSCRGSLGGQAWESELSSSKNKEGGQQGVNWQAEDGACRSQSPCPSHGEEHRSALSLYDNLTDTGAPDGFVEVFDMEMNSQEPFEEHAYTSWASEHMRGLMQGDPLSKEKNLWPPCDNRLTEGCSHNPDQYPDQDERREPELDSGSCVPSLPQHRVREGSPPPCHAKRQDPWLPAETQHLKETPLSVRVPPPLPLADPSASALRSILTGLQQQIIKQREEYEERIISLEQRNEELQVEVVRLKTNLSQQRHWYQVVQAKIVESERARAAAELRNATLQREMDQFFDTFGELNNEAKKTEYIVKSF